LWVTDFYVTFTDSGGVRRTVARNGDVPKVVVTDPLQWHIDHMKRLTDKDMHDLTAYLVTLK
jgi:cytochrome c oxidase cbb3-type subunit 3